MEFAHLHVHSQYSLLDGLAPVRALVDRAVADGQPGIALTDHGNMYGIKELYNYVAKINAKGEHHIKPVLGCEMYVARGSRHDRGDRRDKGYHLIVLAKNLQGYRNLCRLVSDACLNGMYYHPRTDRAMLAANREGLIVCSACLGGEVPQLLMQDDVEGARKAMLWYRDTFGDDYYLELQRHRATVRDANHETFGLQQRVNDQLIAWSREYGIPLVATNDVHFTDEKDGDAHERLVCVSTQRQLADEGRMLYTKQEWLKTQQQMSELFADVPEAVRGTTDILDKVEEYSIDHAPIMPFFEIPADFGTEEQWRERYTPQDLYDEFTGDENGTSIMSPEEGAKKIAKMGGYDKLYRIKLEADYLAKLAYEGARRRYGDPLPKDIDDRVRFELHVMKTMGFPGYFLIVQDFINVGRHELNVSVGPGRGSAAGSVVSYCLGITQIDPLKYDLLFERFLNPDRISLPDIDVDFDDDGRERVLDYVTRKYGADKVAHIITYSTMAAKTAVRDVARLQGLSVAESNRLCKLIPSRMPEVDGKELKPTMANILRYVPEMRAEAQSPSQDIRVTLEYAGKLEGSVRGKGVHACGVIICRDPVTDWVPVDTANDDNAPASKDAPKVIVTQYEGSVIEDTGLIKMDFLGLRTLSIIKDALENIHNSLGIDVDIDHIPLDDAATYRLYCEGRTKGTFQFESPGMQKYLRELKPSQFEDLIAMNALYRPGPMQYIPEFISRKHGRSPIAYDIPEMEKYLKDTYGVTVYQEQVMLLSRLLAGFTRGQSDTLRKAMGKKQIDKMNHLEGLFYEGGEARGHKHDTLAKIWNDWKEFAKYAFNKSHATCYSWVAYQTAYLKAHYPAQYMSAVLSRSKQDKTKLTNYMDECRNMRIPVLGPDINESWRNFGVNKKGEIRFGLEAISGLGAGVTQQIVETRKKDGPFKDIFDLMERLPAGTLNRRVIEALAMSGALDSMPGVRRETFFLTNARDETFSEQLARYSQQYHADKAQESMSLFAFDDEMVASGRPEIPTVPPAMYWSDLTRLDKERELVGMYLSAHPLDPYYMLLTYGMGCTIAQYKELNAGEGQETTFGGLVVSLESRPTKRGDKFGILKIEDFTDTVELRLFGQQYIDYGNLQPGTPVRISGRWQRRYNTQELNYNVTSIRHLDEVKGSLISGIRLQLPATEVGPDLMDTLKPYLRPVSAKHLDAGSLYLMVQDPQTQRSVTLTSPGWRIDITRQLVNALDDQQISYQVLT